MNAKHAVIVVVRFFGLINLLNLIPDITYLFNDLYRESTMSTVAPRNYQASIISTHFEVGTLCFRLLSQLVLALLYLLFAPKIVRSLSKDLTRE